MIVRVGSWAVALGISVVMVAWSSRARAEDDDEPVLRGYFGTAAGPLWISSEAGERNAVRDGFKIDFTLGAALWDQLAVNAGVGLFELEDLTPFSQLVQTCVINGGGTECEEPTSEESVASGFFAFVEAGYQRRFKVAPAVALVPGVLLGYVAPTETPSRGLRCQDCEMYDLPDFDLGGVYVAPFFRTTLVQFFGVSARWQWFLTGDFAHALLFGVEFGLP